MIGAIHITQMANNKPIEIFVSLLIPFLVVVMGLLFASGDPFSIGLSIGLEIIVFVFTPILSHKLYRFSAFFLMPIFLLLNHLAFDFVVDFV